MECQVCFTEYTVITDKIECNNYRCNQYICVDCMSVYLKVSTDDKKIPICPDRQCKYPYTVKNLVHAPHLVPSYVNCCFLELSAEQGGAVLKLIDQDNIVERLRRERQIFIVENFPKAISVVATLIMKSKLTKINKALINNSKKTVIDTSKKCMNLICNGSLDNNLVCILCLTRFCPTCEMTFEPNHVCDKNILQNLEAMKAYTKCPRCSLPIEKSEGCNNMTCASCKQNFTYSNGEISQHGSHNNEIKFRETIFLSLEYKDYLVNTGLFDIIVEIESFCPQKESIVPIHNILKQYFLSPNDKYLTNLAETYEYYIIQKYKCVTYNNVLVQIEKHIISKRLTKKYLLEVLNFIQN